MSPVRGAVATDTGRSLDDLLNRLGGEYGIDSVYLLGGAVIAEGGWNEHATRERKWPDVSYGFGQPSVAWCEILGMQKSSDPRYRNADTPANRENARRYFWDAERALRYTAVRFAPLIKKWDDPVEAWCRWNKPNLAGRLNPNRPHYIVSLDEAESYRVEGPMAFDIKMPEKGEFPDTPQGLAEYQKSLLEFAVAADVAGAYEEAANALKTLNWPKYEHLVPKA